MAIRKNLFLSIQDKSESEDGSDAFVPAVHLKTTEEGNVIVEAVAAKVVISLTDLDDALNEIQEFYNANPAKGNGHYTLPNGDFDDLAHNLVPEAKPPVEKKKQKLMHNIEYKEIDDDPSLKVE